MKMLREIGKRQCKMSLSEIGNKKMTVPLLMANARLGANWSCLLLHGPCVLLVLSQFKYFSNL